MHNDGMISAYGNTDILRKSYKYHMNKNSLYEDLQKLNKKRIKHESEITNLKMKHNEQAVLNKNMEISKIERKIQDL